ncbi:hypothetical protein [Streptosporangium sp. CA-115845]|uniref:hypothetical protein n=1 Tax=Streptosporangium sp. CA-115845 TaxID=3240071 RepID=UPI003D93DC4B
MTNPNSEDVLDAVIDLTGDISAGADVGRLRALAAAALRHTPPEESTRHDDEVRAAIRASILPVEEEPLAIRRSDLLQVDGLSGLAPGERLGPYTVEDGSQVWFDVFFAGTRLVVVETGASAPALVLTKAAPPTPTPQGATVDLGTGTVWIRGDLIDPDLPSGAYAGVKASSGRLTLTGPVSVSGDRINVPSPLKADLTLVPVTDEMTPVAGGCRSAETEIKLPEKLSFRFQPRTVPSGAPGAAAVWGQRFEFTGSIGSWTFVQRLWTVVLDYKIAPMELDTSAIGSALIGFEGTARVTRAGLGLPVVVAAPALLGEAASGANWSLALEGLTARWYDAELPAHEISATWAAVSPGGIILSADALPTSPPVTHTYDLWAIAEGAGQRLPWRQTYDQKFALLYSCDVTSGESFLTGGRATVALDRPVRTNGTAPTTPTGQSNLLLRKNGERTIVTLAAAITRVTAVHQYALRNALLWTTSPLVIGIQGELTGTRQVCAGFARVVLGLYAWAPTLPDPYVANAFIRRPGLSPGSEPRSNIFARISWTSEEVALSFEGQLGPTLAVSDKDASPAGSRPMPNRRQDPDVGPTQVGQNTLTHDDRAAELWAKAQGVEKENRQHRVGPAMERNARTTRLIDNYVTEFLGPAPHVLLLDVSTNQDLLGVGFSERPSGTFPLSGLEVQAQVADLRVVTLPQIQWEPVRTLDQDQDIIELGWFPTPLASATDGGPTQLGARSQRLVPSIPEDVLRGTHRAYQEGTRVIVRTTLPFGLVTAVGLQPQDDGNRRADLYELPRPEFPGKDAVGGLHAMLLADGGRPDPGGVSPTFDGRTGQLINGVDLASGTQLGLSVLGSTGDPGGSVETIFNNDMTARPRVPVTRFDLSGYGGSNFSDWNNPFSAFADTAKVQFRVIVGRTALEVIKVNSVLHPWGIRVTRSVTVERRPGGGVIRRDSGWQPFTPGLFDYRYADDTGTPQVADYAFDAGVFRGLFDVRSIRPAPGSPVSSGTATMIPYYFDADLALDGLSGRTHVVGVLGYLQTAPSKVPASSAALTHLIQTQGAVGGPVDAWIDVGGGGLLYRVQRIEVGVTFDGPKPVFVATARGVPKLPRTGAWSVVTRPVASVPPGGGEAVPVSDSQGVPLIRRYPVAYSATDRKSYSRPPLVGASGDYRFADAADLFTPATPQKDYALLQSTPTHAFLFPRPTIVPSAPHKVRSDMPAALADLIARSTSKGAFPPPGNTIELGAGAFHLDVGNGGALSLSSPVTITGHPTPLRIAGSDGHGSSLFYDTATLKLDLQPDRWSAEFTGLRIWSDVTGLKRLTGSELRVVGSTDRRPQIAELKTLILTEIEQILSYIPLMGDLGVQGPIDLGASNAKHEIKVEAKFGVTIPPTSVSFAAGADLKLKLYVRQSTGFDLAAGGVKAAATFGAELNGKVPLLSIGVAAVFLIVTLKAEFSITSVTGVVTSERLDLMAFVGIGVEGRIGPFKAYAFLGIGFLLSYNAISDTTRYGGLVALEAGVDLKVVQVKIRAELKGLIYKDGATTKCDYSGQVKLEVEIFLFFSISATYVVTETAAL